MVCFGTGKNTFGTVVGGRVKIGQFGGRNKKGAVPLEYFIAFGSFPFKGKKNLTVDRQIAVQPLYPCYAQGAVLLAVDRFGNVADDIALLPVFRLLFYGSIRVVVGKKGGKTGKKQKNGGNGEDGKALFLFGPAP